MVWQDDGDVFTVRSCYLKIVELRRTVLYLGCIHKNWSKVWLEEIPSKINFFVWVSARGRTLTTEQLKRRGFSLAGRCPFCQCEEEDIEHLFYRCSFTALMWDFSYGTATVAGVALTPFRI